MFLAFSFAYLTEFISAHILFSSAAEKKYKSGKCFLIGAILFGISIIICFVVRKFTWINLIIYLIIDILYAYLCFDMGIKKSILYGTIVTLIGVIWEVFVEITLLSVTGADSEELLTSVLAVSICSYISKMLLFISVLILSRFVAKNDAVKLPVSVTIYPIVLIIVLLAFWEVCEKCQVNSTGQLALAITAAGLIIPTVLFFLIYQRNIERENELFCLKKEMDKIETEKSYYDILDKQNQNLRIYVHDTKKHLAAIKSLNTDPQIEKYLNKITENLATYSKVSRSGNHSFDVIINRYVTECAIKKLNFTFDTRLKNLEYIENYDLVTILGNLLDNALESAEQSQNREITLSTDCRNGYDVLIITNSCDIEPKSLNNKLITTKADKKLHGIGLKSVAKTLLKYNGDFDWDYDEQNKIFTATVMMSEVK